MIVSEKTVKREVIYKGRVLEYVVDKVDVGGRESSREMVFHPGGVGIVAIDDDGYVCMVRQFRKPYEKAILEIPAGKIDPGEEPLVCGKRELIEETGYRAKEFISLGEFYPSVGYTNEVIHIFLATGLTKGEANPDDDEYVDIERIHIDELVSMIISGEIKDGKTIAGIMKAKYIMEKHNL